MYMSLAHSLIERILSTAADCEPPGDVALRLESIIQERDALKAALDEALHDPQHEECYALRAERDALKARLEQAQNVLNDIRGEADSEKPNRREEVQLKNIVAWAEKALTDLDAGKESGK